MAEFLIKINGWHPTRLNKLLGDWRRSSRLKKSDRDNIALEMRRHGVVPATGCRRVRLEIVLGPRQRGGDPDAYWKSLLDGLKACGAIVDDRPGCVELGEVTYSRGAKGCVIILADVATKRRTA